MPQPYPKTTCWTDAQKAAVNEVLSELRAHIHEVIAAHYARIKEMDKRPKQVWSKEQPDVFFPYVRQGMLEDLIADLVEDV